MFVGDTLLASASRIRLKCPRCKRTLGVAGVDAAGAISYQTVHPVSYRFRVPFQVEEVDDKGSITTREVYLEDLAADGFGQLTGRPDQDRIHFREHRRRGDWCSATPTVSEAWLNDQVRAAIAAGLPAVSLA